MARAQMKGTMRTMATTDTPEQCPIMAEQPPGSERGDRLHLPQVRRWLQRVSYRTATAMVAARFIQPLFDQSERALSVVLAVPCNALAASATDPRARFLAAVQPLFNNVQPLFNSAVSNGWTLHRIHSMSHVAVDLFTAVCTGARSRL